VSVRVVHYIDTVEFGGAEQALLNLMASLDRRWESVLFCHSDPGVARLREGAASLGVKVRTVPRLQGSPASSIHLARAREIRDAVAGFPRFLLQLKQEKPAVFHAHCNWPLACKWGLLAAAAANVPAIIATVQLFPKNMAAAAARLQHRVLASIVDRFIPVSDGMRKQLVQAFVIPSHKLETVPNGVDTRTAGKSGATAPLEAVVPATESTYRYTVLTPARLHEQKGHRYLLHAAAMVPAARFILAGDGPERPSLERQAVTLGIADRVLFLGHRQDLSPWMAASDIVVVPSLWEGMPLAVLEAMAAGKAVLACDIEGVSEAIIHGKSGLLVPPCDHRALADAIHLLLAKPELRARLGKAAEERAQEFSARSTAARVARIYDAVLNQTNAIRSHAS
jgi:glycosyltransferase involved in cell wall biosynthesis